MRHRIVAFLLLLIGGLISSSSTKADDAAAIADKDVKAFVDQRIKDWQPTAEEKRFDEIGWCTSLLEAEELAKKHKRPIFLFTHDGKMQVGRC